MSVKLRWTTATRTLPAITPLAALSVPVMLALGEMESTAQVRHTPVMDRITVMVINKH